MQRILVVFALLFWANLLSAQTDQLEYKISRTIADVGRVESLAFCADEKTAFTGSADGSIRLINLSDGTSRRVASGSGAVTAADCSRAESMGAGAASDGTIWLSRAAGPAQPLKGHHGRIPSIKFSPKAEFLVSAGDDHNVIVWDPSSGRELFRLDNPSKKTVKLAGFSAGGVTLLGVTETGTILEWDIKNRSLLRQVQDTEKGATVFSADVSFDGRILAVASELTQLPKGWASGSAGLRGPMGGPRGAPAAGPGGTGSSDPQAGNATYQTGRTDPSGLVRQDAIKIYALPGLAVLKPIGGVDGQIVSMSVSADNRFLAGARKRQKGTFLSIYDLGRGIEIASLPMLDGSKVTQFSPNGSWLGNVGMDGGLQIIAVSGVLRSSGAGALGGRRIQITSQDTKPLLNPDSPIVIAVMDLAPLQVQPDTGGAVAEMIRNRISGAKNVAMVERQRMPDIKREQGFQYSDLADPDTAVRLGRAIGARKMIFGSLSKLGATYTINVRMVDVETSLIDGVREVQCRACTEDDLPEAVAELKEAVVGSNR